MTQEKNKPVANDSAREVFVKESVEGAYAMKPAIPPVPTPKAEEKK